jgi:hypothetical protein
LAINPPRGGIPAIDLTEILNVAAKKGFTRPNPPRSEMYFADRRLSVGMEVKEIEVEEGTFWVILCVWVWVGITRTLERTANHTVKDILT